MKNILFTHSYFLRFDPKQWKLQQPYPPLGTLYAAAVLRNAGYSVNLFDNMFAEGPNDIQSKIISDNPDVLVIYDDGFNYLTKMCLTNMREAAFDMIHFAKQHGCLVVVSSSDSTDHFENYLNKGADFILIGEGEVTLLELINALNNQQINLENIHGLALKNKENIIKTSPRSVLKDLDSLPLPAWDLVDMVQYKNTWKTNLGYFSINMTTTRGCPYKCNWCAKPIYGNRYNIRSPQHIVDELKFLKEKYSFDHIWFCDDIFGLKPGWINEFANLVTQQHLKLRFKIQCRVDLLLEENNIAALANAGCETVWMGAESGSQEILDAMDKGTTVEQIYEATRLLNKYNIKPAFFLQFGYPGETKKDIDATIKMVMELLPNDIGVSISYPLPGTKFYENVKSELQIKSNWADSDELSLLFKNTYCAAFYKELHRYIHKNYRTMQGLHELRRIFINQEKISLLALKKIVSIPFHLYGKYVHQYKMWKLNKVSI